MHAAKLQNICICLLMLALPLAVTAQGYVQQVGAAGNVDWTSQVVRCTGIGAPNPNAPLSAQRAGALRAAKLDAQRNLLETIKGVYLTSETTVENAILMGDVIISRVEGTIRNARVIDTRYMSTGDVEVDMEVPLTGVISDAILPQQFGGGALMTGGGLFCPVCGQPWPAGKPVPAGVTLVQGEAENVSGTGGVYTGLIVDARGLGIRPAMAPQLLDERGDEVYGSRFVTREYAVDIGMVGYEKDIDRARMNERVADNPLVVKALEASGANRADLVISAADAQKVHNAATNMNFLQHCKVMFILD